MEHVWQPEHSLANRGKRESDNGQMRNEKGTGDIILEKRRKGISSYCVFKSVYSSIGPNKDVKVLFQKYVDTHAGSIHQTDRPDIMQLLCSCSITCVGLRVCVWGSGHFVNTHPILIYETLLTHFYNLHTHMRAHTINQGLSESARAKEEERKGCS